MSPDVEKLLKVASRLYLSGEKGSLGAHFRALQTAAKAPSVIWKKEFTAFPVPQLPQMERWQFNGYGGFAMPEGDYVIDMPKETMTPAPWCNLLCSPGFGTLVSESGPMFTYDDNSHHGRVTRWPNDPVSKTGGRVLPSG
jgi:cellobiose phosphorylase